MALAAIHVADRARDRRPRTFGLYRLEILAALANAVLLFVVAIYVVVEAVRRWGDPPDVLVGPMLVVGDRRPRRQPRGVRLLRSGSEGEPERRGRLPRGAVRPRGLGRGDRPPVVIGVTDWAWVDPVVGVAIGVFILPRTWRLGAQAVRILVQAAAPARPRGARGRRCGASTGWSTCTTSTCGR